MKTKNIFKEIPEDLELEHFLDLARTDDIAIERIVSKGHKSPEHGWYDQDKAEWVILLKGEAELEFENGKTVKLAAGDYLSIPAHRKHRVSWTSSIVECVWLAVHYKESSS